MRPAQAGRPRLRRALGAPTRGRTGRGQDLRCTGPHRPAARYPFWAANQSGSKCAAAGKCAVDGTGDLRETRQGLGHQGARDLIVGALLHHLIDTRQDLRREQARAVFDRRGTPKVKQSLQYPHLSLQYPRSHSTIGSFALEVWSVDGTNHTPVAKVADVGTGDAALLSTTSAIFTLSGLNLSLSPLTDYFLLAKGINLVRENIGMQMPGYIAWDVQSPASGTGFPSNQSIFLVRPGVGSLKPTRCRCRSLRTRPRHPCRRRPCSWHWV